MFESNIIKWKQDRPMGTRLLEKAVEKHVNTVEHEIHQRKRLEHRRGLQRKPKHIPLIENDDSEHTKRVKYLATEQTYEVWHGKEQLNKNIMYFLRQQDVNNEIGYTEGIRKVSRKRMTEDEDDDTDASSKKEEDEVYPVEEGDENEQKIRSINTRPGVYCETMMRLKKAGLEVLPHITPENPTEKNSMLYQSVPYSQRHSTVVTTILHINVLRKNWKVAYRCFTLLVRMKIVDLRSIWPIGLEILIRLAEEEYKENQPEGYIDEYNLRTHFLEIEKKDPSELPSKDEQFLKWLHNFFEIPKYDLDPSVPHTAIPYRMGTKTSSPMFVQTLIWIMLMKQKYQAVNELLESIMLREPYINDGMYYYLQALSYQLEASSLSKADSSEIDKHQIEKLMADSERYIEKAAVRGVLFPEKLIRNETNIIKARLIQDLEFGREINDDGYLAYNEGDSAEGDVPIHDVDGGDDFANFNNYTVFDNDNDDDGFSKSLESENFEDLDGGDEDDEFDG